MLAETVPLAELADKERMLGFERVELMHGSTFRDVSTVVVVPTRARSINYKVVSAWENMISPMNQKRAKLYAVGEEVGVAYNKMIEYILKNPELSTYKYVLSLEDDNLPPRDAHIRLLESIDTGPFDAVSGIYFTKGDVNMPMAFGDPKLWSRDGVMDFKPRNVVEALATGNIIEVNGVAMGCTLWRMDVFRKIEPPWFVTVNDLIPEKGGVCMTQDLFFCERMRRAACRLAVDLRVRVGHLDVKTEMVY